MFDGVMPEEGAHFVRGIVVSIESRRMPIDVAELDAIIEARSFARR